MITIKSLYKSARLRSLPLSLSGIFVGTSLAWGKGFFRWEVFAFALLTTMLYQILSDYANDYGDAQKGTDNENRVGPKRAIQSGEMTLSEMKKVIYFVLVLAFIATILLLWFAFGKEKLGFSILFFLLGISAMVAAIKYTIGRNAYGYLGLGDVFVFIFFGLVSVLGSYGLFVQSYQWKLALPAVGIGLFSTAVLNLNNMRDIQNDSQMGKKTLVTILGASLAKYYHYLLILGGMISFLLFSILSWEFGWSCLYVLGFIPLIFHLFYVKSVSEAYQYDSQLKVVALSTFLIALLFFFGRM